MVGIIGIEIRERIVAGALAAKTTARGGARIRLAMMYYAAYLAVRAVVQGRYRTDRFRHNALLRPRATPGRLLRPRSMISTAISVRSGDSLPTARFMRDAARHFQGTRRSSLTARKTAPPRSSACSHIWASLEMLLPPAKHLTRGQH